MSKKIVLIINNCKECPHHIVASARLTEEMNRQIAEDVSAGKPIDRFKREPLSVYCNKINTMENVIATYTPPVSPDKLTKLCEIPEWCPLFNN